MILSDDGIDAPVPDPDATKPVRARGRARVFPDADTAAPGIDGTGQRRTDAAAPRLVAPYVVGHLGGCTPPVPVREWLSEPGEPLCGAVASQPDPGYRFATAHGRLGDVEQLLITIPLAAMTGEQAAAREAILAGVARARAAFDEVLTESRPSD